MIGEPGASNRKWITDFNYTRTWSEFVYVALVVDCYSRAIVYWHAATVKDTAMVTANSTRSRPTKTRLPTTRTPRRASRRRLIHEAGIKTRTVTDLVRGRTRKPGCWNEFGPGTGSCVPALVQQGLLGQDREL